MTTLDHQWIKQNCGIDILTGEAERITPAFRLLCDLNQTAIDLLAEWIGAQSIQFPPSFNSTYTVGSAMLSRSLIRELAILRGLTLFTKVIEFGNELHVFDNVQDEMEFDIEKYKQFYGDVTIYSIMYDQRGQGARCQHQMSGRTI